MGSDSQLIIKTEVHVTLLFRKITRESNIRETDIGIFSPKYQKNIYLMLGIILHIIMNNAKKSFFENILEGI